MKLLMMILLLCTSGLALAGGPKRLCTLKHSKYVISVAEKHSGLDKNRHCTVSCMLSLRCNRGEVLLIGYLKEFRDVFGEGTPERADMAANRYGISLVKHKRAENDSECLSQCDLRY